jgi:16S rRNA (cytosine1402-N4)-methyltransferase
MSTRTAPRAGGRYLDGTLGGGGHAEAILEACGPDGRLLGLDRDDVALEAAGRRLAPFGQRVELRRSSFSEMAEQARVLAPLDGVVLDLGVSSPQLDHAERGFSFQQDGPLDMRMDRRQAVNAAGLVNGLEESELADIIYQYGEEPRSRRIARAIVAGRPWSRTLPLAECVARASGWGQSRVHPATRTFQALRIAVNRELEELDVGLRAALGLLRPGGRLAVISFHSLEDRRVKHLFREWSGQTGPRDPYGRPVVAPLGRLLAPGGIAGAAQDVDNPRARSARLRGFEKAEIES